MYIYFEVMLTAHNCNFRKQRTFLFAWGFTINYISCLYFAFNLQLVNHKKKKNSVLNWHAVKTKVIILLFWYLERYQKIEKSAGNTEVPNTRAVYFSTKTAV